MLHTVTQQRAPCHPTDSHSSGAPQEPMCCTTRCRCTESCCSCRSTNKRTAGCSSSCSSDSGQLFHMSLSPLLCRFCFAARAGGPPSVKAARASQRNPGPCSSPHATVAGTSHIRCLYPHLACHSRDTPRALPVAAAAASTRCTTLIQFCSALPSLWLVRTRTNQSRVEITVRANQSGARADAFGASLLEVI